jgi:hypothetical protein
MILIASNGHALTHIPQPMQRDSDIKQMVEAGVTIMHCFPVLLTGHDFLHSYLHLFGLHLSGFTIAILNLSKFSTIIVIMLCIY